MLFYVSKSKYFCSIIIYKGAKAGSNFSHSNEILGWCDVWIAIKFVSLLFPFSSFPDTVCLSHFSFCHSVFPLAFLKTAHVFFFIFMFVMTKAWYYLVLVNGYKLCFSIFCVFPVLLIKLVLHAVFINQWRVSDIDLSGRSLWLQLNFFFLFSTIVKYVTTVFMECKTTVITEKCGHCTLHIFSCLSIWMQVSCYYPGGSG